MKYKVEVHYENQSVLTFVQEIDGTVEEWTRKCLANQYFLCRDALKNKFVVCNSKSVTGILIEPIDAFEEDHRANLEDYRTDKDMGDLS